MGGKNEGLEVPSRPILLLVSGLEPEVRGNLETGLEKIGLNNVQIFDHKVDPGRKIPIIEHNKLVLVIASGITALEFAREASDLPQTHAIPDINLFIPENPDLKGLGKVVADYLLSICSGINYKEQEQPKPKIQIDPREAKLPRTKDPLTLDEIKKLFAEKFPKDPYLFVSNGIEVAVYLDDPPGNLPIEFSLEEFYTILKIVEVTQAKSITWEKGNAISK